MHWRCGSDGNVCALLGMGSLGAHAPRQPGMHSAASAPWRALVHALSGVRRLALLFGLIVHFFFLVPTLIIHATKAPSDRATQPSLRRLAEM